LNQSFIDIVPEKYINDEDYLDYIINKNKRVSLKTRNLIREYAVKNHSYDVTIPNYLKMIESLNII
jgi:methyltransferase-like protein